MVLAGNLEKGGGGGHTLGKLSSKCGGEERISSTVQIPKNPEVERGASEEKMTIRISKRN